MGLGFFGISCVWGFLGTLGMVGTPGALEILVILGVFSGLWGSMVQGTLFRSPQVAPLGLGTLLLEEPR